MMIILFILLAVSIYLIRHFENKRNTKNEEQREKRKEAYQNLLRSLQKNKDTSHSNKEKI